MTYLGATFRIYVNLKMETVCLKPLYHRGQESIGIYFENNSSLNVIVKKLPDVRRSQTNKCWYIPLSKENYNNLFFCAASGCFFALAIKNDG